MDTQGAAEKLIEAAEVGATEARDALRFERGTPGERIALLSAAAQAMQAGLAGLAAAAKDAGAAVDNLTEEMRRNIRHTAASSVRVYDLKDWHEQPAFRVEVHYPGGILTFPPNAGNFAAYLAADTCRRVQEAMVWAADPRATADEVREAVLAMGTAEPTPPMVGETPLPDIPDLEDQHDGDIVEVLYLGKPMKLRIGGQWEIDGETVALRGVDPNGSGLPIAVLSGGGRMTLSKLVREGQKVTDDAGRKILRVKMPGKILVAAEEQSGAQPVGVTSASGPVGDRVTAAYHRSVVGPASVETSAAGMPHRRVLTSVWAKLINGADAWVKHMPKDLAESLTLALEWTDGLVEKPAAASPASPACIACAAAESSAIRSPGVPRSNRSASRASVAPTSAAEAQKDREATPPPAPVKLDALPPLPKEIDDAIHDLIAAVDHEPIGDKRAVLSTAICRALAGRDIRTEIAARVADIFDRRTEMARAVPISMVSAELTIDAETLGEVLRRDTERGPSPSDLSNGV